VLAAQSLGQDGVGQAAPGHLGGSPAEQQLGGVVPAVDAAVLVHADERVVRHLDDGLHPLLAVAPAAVGGVLQGQVADDDREADRPAAVRAQGGHRDPDAQDPAVGTPPRRLHPRRLPRGEDLAEQAARRRPAGGRTTSTRWRPRTSAAGAPDRRSAAGFQLVTVPRTSVVAIPSSDSRSSAASSASAAGRVGASSTPSIVPHPWSPAQPPVRA
jgi:hypothetical protein